MSIRAKRIATTWFSDGRCLWRWPFVASKSRKPRRPGRFRRGLPRASKLVSYLAQTAIRPPAVAGLFYPREAHILADTVSHLLANATPRPPFPKALIVPHAGYVYSGPIAASAYAQLQGAHHIERVVLIGPAHRVPVHG